MRLCRDTQTKWTEGIDKMASLENQSIRFYTASWCGTCKVIHQVMDKVKAQYLDTVVSMPLTYVSLDKEEGQMEAVRMGILSLPTILFCLDGEKYCEIKARTEQGIIDEIERIRKEIRQ